MTTAVATIRDVPFTIGGRSFHSRVMVGTGKYRDNDTMARAIEASGAEIVTVAVRRVDLDRTKKEGVLYHLDAKRYFLLANTAGCYTAEDAVRYARLAREAGFNEFIKLEVIGDQETLLPDVQGLLVAARTLVAEGFKVLAYTNEDLVTALRLEDAGCAAVMPLASPIGSGLGLLNPFGVRTIKRRLKVPVVVDAGVLRRRGQLDRMLELATANPRLHDVLRLGAYQLRALARVPAYAAVSTSVELAREVAGEKAARYVNQALRRLARDALKDSLTVAGCGMRDAVETHPLWLVKRWKVQFGRSETERLMDWNDARAPLTLQPARWDATTLRARLTKAGFGVREAPFGAGVVVQAGATHPASRIPPPAQLPGFAEGGFVVQDPAHALVGRYAAFPPGAMVYDACAAPGGKSVALERGGARLLAGDGRRERVGRLVETARRAGVAIQVAVADLLAAPFRSEALAAVLVDAPCSATGTMARHPDARWRVTQRTT